ncbi:MAG: CehA/McbA family metallohydrolase [Ignavibacteria bacterium]
MYEYAGAVHIHSVYSDGTGKIEEIAKAAYDSDLDFILMTDHNTLKSKDDGYEKWLNNVMVIVGYEVNDMANKNHYLTFGIDEVIGSYQELANGELGCKLSAKEYVKQIKDKGGIGFLAHPDEERKHLPEHPSYPWLEETDDYTGIEIWNHMSEWIEGMNEGNKIDRFLHPLKSIISPSVKTLKRWDLAAMKRHVTGIGGVDAHALKQNVLGFFEVEIFAYKVLFKSIRTHVLIDEPIVKNNNAAFEKDKCQILEALKNGKCFFANYNNGNPKGFRFFAEFKGMSCNMGDSITSNGENIQLKALVPQECIVKLIHNGNLISESKTMNTAWNVKKPGVYRVECWTGDRGWIFSNHIRVN